MNARLAEDVFLESEFFDRAEHMREQLSAALGPAGDGIFKQVSSPGAYSFLLASAAQVFTQDLVFDFLNRLRRWACQTVGAQHASTPQIHIYVRGCGRALAPDAVKARWHYLYSLTSSKAPVVHLLAAAPSQKGWFKFSLNRITELLLPFNAFLVHETCTAYAINGPKQATNLLHGSIFLHGYLW